jgi:hypothetical protein
MRVDVAPTPPNQVSIDPIRAGPGLRQAVRNVIGCANTREGCEDRWATDGQGALSLVYLPNATVQARDGHDGQVREFAGRAHAAQNSDSAGRDAGPSADDMGVLSG